MAIHSNQSIPHHIIITAMCPKPADEAMRRTGITWQKERLLISHMQLPVINNHPIWDLDDAAMWVAFVFAALKNARHVLPSPSSFATWEYLGAMVDFPFIVQSLLHGSNYQC
jgi:hypothetical protein